MIRKGLFGVCLLLAAGAWSCNDVEEEYVKTCGNGVLDSMERCDGEMFAADARKCPEGKQVSDVKLIKCKSDCTVDVSACVAMPSTCGNGKIDEGKEKCDGSLLGGATCASVLGEGFEGELKCKTDCSDFDSSACTKKPVNCGNNVLDTGEACDVINGAAVFEGSKTCKDFKGEDGQGELKCSATCEIDSSACVVVEKCSAEEEGKNKCKDGAQLQCKNGVWESTMCELGKTCPDGKEVCEEKTCDKEDAVLCDSVKGESGVMESVFVCKGGKYSLQKKCEAGYRCDAEKADCVLVGECVKDKCEGGKLRKCVDGKLQEGVDCESGAQCLDGMDKCVMGFKCVDDECRNGKLHKCVDGKLQEGEACGEGMECVDGANACSDMKCKEDKCEGGKLRRCVEGKLQEAEFCSNRGQVCKDNEKVCSDGCMNGTYQCTVENSIQICENYAWKEKQACSKSKVCRVLNAGKDAQCYDSCKADVCKENKMFKCTGGALLGDSTPCGEGKVCNAEETACVDKASKWDFCETFELMQALPTTTGNFKRDSAVLKNISWDFVKARAFQTNSQQIDGNGVLCDGSAKTDDRCSISTSLKGKISKVGVTVKSANARTQDRQVVIKLGSQVVAEKHWKEGSNVMKIESKDVQVLNPVLKIEQWGQATSIDNICWNVSK